MFYLDAAATTQPYPSVVQCVRQCMEEEWGNASSAYQIGVNARRKIEEVRQQIADDINCSPEEIIFTSGGCEANSLALNTWGRLFTTYLEHKSIVMNANAHTAAYVIKNDKYGNVSLDDLREKMTWAGGGDVVSICAASGEIGTIQDVQTLRQYVPQNVIFHTDATQLYPQQRIDVQEWNIDMMSISGQKFHAPKGVGFLYVRHGTPIYPLIWGTQEDGLRGGTYNTPLICGMGEALRCTRNNERPYDNQVEYIYQTMMQIDGVQLLGAPIQQNRLKGNLTFYINGVDAETLVTLADLHCICIAAGSACNTGRPEPSQAYIAVGLTEEQAKNVIRLTWDTDVKDAIPLLVKLINEVRYL